MKWLKKLMSMFTGRTTGIVDKPQESRQQIHNTIDDRPEVAESRQQIHDTDI
ncbi:MAG: hypothetical protein ACRBK7_10495 [Acidimicrobiales bacterium]